MTISYAFNFIPWWVWLAAALVGLALTVQFWTPIWTVMPTWMKFVLGAIGAIVMAYVAGRNRGSKDERDQRAKADARAVETRKETDDEVRNLPPDDLDRRLDKWVRDK